MGQGFALMALERTYHCDGPDCERHASTAAPPPHMPFHFLVILAEHANGRDELHFCGWDCVLRYAGAKEPETIIYPGDDLAQ